MTSRGLRTERNDVGIPRGSPEQVSPQSTSAPAQITGEFKLSLNLHGFDYSFGFRIEPRGPFMEGPGNPFGHLLRPKCVLGGEAVSDSSFGLRASGEYPGLARKGKCPVTA